MVKIADLTDEQLQKQIKKFQEKIDSYEDVEQSGQILKKLEKEVHSRTIELDVETSSQINVKTDDISLGRRINRPKEKKRPAVKKERTTREGPSERKDKEALGQRVGFLKRLLAYIIDGLFVWLIIFVLGIFFGILFGGADNTLGMQAKKLNAEIQLKTKMIGTLAQQIAATKNTREIGQLKDEIALKQQEIINLNKRYVKIAKKANLPSPITSIIMLIAMFAYAYLDVFRGATFGKSILHICIGSINGGGASKDELVKRYLIKYIIIYSSFIATVITLPEIVRNILYFIVGLYVIISALMIAFSSKKQAIHDQLSKTAAYHNVSGF